MAAVSSIDAHVGGKCRQLRQNAGLTLGDLAENVGIAESLLADMEAGRERIGAADMFRISKCLNAPIGAFFEGLQS